MTTQDDSTKDAKKAAIPDERLDALKQNVTRLKRKIDDQSARLQALARGREQSMTTVSELRAELALVAAERDRLRKELTNLEGMQTETLALDEEASDATFANHGELASIDELMATFSGGDATLSASHSTLKVEAAGSEGAAEYEEMISPELIVLGSSRTKPAATADRFLVLLEQGAHKKCKLNEDLLTIGRSDSADIQIEGDFISRIHARILRIGMDSVIEDAGSKNGTRVNGELVKRHVLKHGDLVRVGSANFRFVDTAQGESAGD